MNSTAFIVNIIIANWWLFLLPLLIVILKSPFVKGIFGEWLVLPITHKSSHTILPPILQHETSTHKL